MSVYTKEERMNCYKDNAAVLKAFADETRLQIIDMLSCGELCACRILEYFDITQPTLSYHMKILTECGIVAGRRQGAWMYYSLREENIAKMLDFLKTATSFKEECICNTCSKKNAAGCENKIINL